MISMRYEGMKGSGVMHSEVRGLASELYTSKDIKHYFASMSFKQLHNVLYFCDSQEQPLMLEPEIYSFIWCSYPEWLTISH